MKNGMHNSWIRIIICLFAGGATQELVHITTGDPNRPEEGNFTMLYAVLYFILVTALLVYNKKQGRINKDIEDIGKE